MAGRLVDPGQLGEAVHTAFRKATDHADATTIHRLISGLPYEEWGRLIDWIADAAGITPTALVLQHDLLQILAGHTMTVWTTDDWEVRIRMYATEEFLDYHHRLVDAHPELGGSKISHEQAWEQTRRWDLEETLRSRRLVVDPAHGMRLVDAPKMDARNLVRAVCSCGDYTSTNDTPSGATRAWLAHWTAKTKGIGQRPTLAEEINDHGNPI